MDRWVKSCIEFGNIDRGYEIHKTRGGEPSSLEGYKNYVLRTFRVYQNGNCLGYVSDELVNQLIEDGIFYEKAYSSTTRVYMHRVIP
jgi:hypothetical protein